MGKDKELTDDGEINWRYQILNAMTNEGTHFHDKSAEKILENFVEDQVKAELKEELEPKLHDILTKHARNSGDYIPDYAYGKVVRDILNLFSQSDDTNNNNQNT